MKKRIKIFYLPLFVLMIFASCKNEKSLQEYLVESQDKKGFITVDVPASFLQLKNKNASEDVKSALKSIHKINIVALPIKGNKATYKVEKNKLKNIFKDNNEYKNLMSIKAKGINVKLYYTGNTDSVDEVIVFGYGDETGVGLSRLKGDNMNPANIAEMMMNMKIDTKNINLDKFKVLFE